MTPKADAPMPRGGSGSPRAAAPTARRHARVAASLPVRCTRATRRGSQYWRGRTVNVGGGGFAVELPTRLRPGTRVAIEIRTGIGPLHVEADVLWTRRVVDRAAFTRHGLCLVERDEVLDLPVGVLLGQWLQALAEREAAASRRTDRA